MDEEKKLSMPAIIIIVAIIAVVGFLLSKAKMPIPQQNNQKQASNTPTEPPFDPKNIPAVSNTDFSSGPAEATTTIILYSDSQCPYCRVFYPELKKYLSQNPETRFVYRPTPFHTTGQVEEKAMDCANEQGGYWEYLDAIYTSQDTENITEPARLTKIATELGLEEKKFSECLASGKYDAKIQEYLTAARNAKISGTPTSIIIGSKGTVPIKGAVTAETLAKTVDSVK